LVKQRKDNTHPEMGGVTSDKKHTEYSNIRDIYGKKKKNWVGSLA
jgi:hypothetical protein